MADPKIYPRLKKLYDEKIRAELKSEFNYSNIHEVPNLTKIVVSMGLGDAARDSKIIPPANHDLALITGQFPKTSKARKSIAQFKLREGQTIGASSTLRGTRMWEFYDRVTALAIPRMRDFRGFSPKQFDGHGNYTFGLTEQLVFPEIDPDSIEHVRGMDITIVTTAKTDPEALSLLKKLGFPFKER
jgi:large subunit ribosomal protein L5